MIQDKLLHIVLADDDDDDRELFELALEELNVKVKLSQAVNGDKLLTMLEQEELPDVVFLDLNMPLKTGIECLRIIRGNERLKDLPIIILSTSRAARDIDICYNLQANFYIVKPFSYIDLSKVIKSIFNDDWQHRITNLPKDKFVFNGSL